ncbi:MAG: hypothetical protein BGP24_00370 [Lysobacterales bacterium 69-70]|nr:MAG: hypothetical protein ABS97_02600 [Xanthomonadaceae bacterium SCN 69-320]ODV17933.1 MAG: hypothetical protein ABT27_15885 [Xanthomonadaceae bacterium SCN 69-25]OJY99310.1 MAG: hypothetical protein BGP24_00370 [Xanthomonadales bacterium 69-70]
MALLFAAALAAMTSTAVDLESASAEERYTVEIKNWRAERRERLTSPTGWLSLVGLHWLKDGDNTVGSAKDNDIVIAAAPPKLGTATLAGGKVTFALHEGSVGVIGGSDRARSGTLQDDASTERPTQVAFGTASFYVIDRNGKKALRVRDTEAPTRKNFLGLDYFDVAEKWRIEAKWEAFDPPKTLEVPTVLGTVEKYQVPGKAVFERGGKHYEVQPVFETPGAKQLFLIFADKTSGKETYGAARFLYSDLPKDGKIVLDFNKAYNPPCAFTPYATCPLAPPENRLNLRVDAGEKKYKGSAH